ncbi:MAG: hypothetical protein V4510_07175 [bacterium]
MEKPPGFWTRLPMRNLYLGVVATVAGVANLVLGGDWKLGLGALVLGVACLAFAVWVIRRNLRERAAALANPETASPASNAPQQDPNDTVDGPRLPLWQRIAIFAAIGAPVLAAGWASAIVALTSHERPDSTQWWLFGSLMWMGLVGPLAAYRFRDRLAPGWRGGMVLYGAMGLVGIVGLAMSGRPSWPPWAIPTLFIGFFGAVFVAAYLMRRDTEAPAPRAQVKGQPLPPDVTSRRRTIVLGLAMAAIAVVVTLVQAGILSPSQPAPAYAGTGTYVWVPLQNVTAPLTVKGDGALYIVSPQRNGTTDAMVAPQNTSRLEARVDGAGPQPFVHFWIETPAGWVRLDGAGGADGTWELQDEALVGGTAVRVEVGQVPSQMADRTAQVHLTFQARGVIECGTYTWNDGTTKSECKPLRYPA